MTFAAAVFVQDIRMRLGAMTHRGFGELIFQRFGPAWGWTSTGDLLLTNIVTIIGELVAIRVGLSFSGIPAWVGVAGTVGLVAISGLSSSYERWGTVALGLAFFNLLFLPAAWFSHPDPSAIGRALTTWTPLPRGSGGVFLLIVASDIGATVTPWMLFFQQGATADKGITKGDVPHGRVDTITGGVLAGIAGCASLIVAIPLLHHHVVVLDQGGAAYAQTLRPFIGNLGASLFAIGLIEAGALAMFTIPASTTYAFGESLPGRSHSFNATVRQSREFHLSNMGLALIAEVVTLIPGVPLLALALSANLLATILMPIALVFVLLLINDQEVVGPATNGLVVNAIGVMITIVVIASGVGYATVAFAQSIR